MTMETSLAPEESVHREQRAGRLGTLNPYHGFGARLLSHVPSKRPLRALALGLGTLCVLGPPLAIALIASGFSDVSLPTFVVYKGVLGVALGLLITPLVALAAMADEVGR